MGNSISINESRYTEGTDGMEITLSFDGVEIGRWHTLGDDYAYTNRRKAKTRHAASLVPKTPSPAKQTATKATPQSFCPNFASLTAALMGMR